MEAAIREFSGRAFSAEDMSTIKQTAAAYPKLSQKELAATVCELIGWVQTNGNPKTTQCVAFMRKLAEEGQVRLPKLDEMRSRNARMGRSAARGAETGWQDRGEVRECGAISLEIARPGESLRRWRAYVSEHHELGDPHVHGCQMRYTIKGDGGRDLGCMLFSASSWSLSARDEWIGWTPAERKARLHLVVNNSRLLLLPWVHVKNLASRALSAAARAIQSDWLDAYCYAPALLETFVDETKYKGTCYKAANWARVGETQGRGRNDRRNERALTRKAIYMYPLRRDFRAVLKGVKPCKSSDPDAR
jgi:hypothetical protein